MSTGAVHTSSMPLGDMNSRASRKRCNHLQCTKFKGVTKKAPAVGNGEKGALQKAEETAVKHNFDYDSTRTLVSESKKSTVHSSRKSRVQQARGGELTSSSKIAIAKKVQSRLSGPEGSKARANLARAAHLKKIGDEYSMLDRTQTNINTGYAKKHFENTGQTLLETQSRRDQVKDLLQRLGL